MRCYFRQNYFMKKLFYIISTAFALGLYSCGEDKTQSYVIDCDFADEIEEREYEVPNEERAYIKAYLDENSIVAIEHAEGFFYTIVEPGDEVKLERCYNTVTNFKIFTFDGHYIDFGTGTSFSLYDTGTIIGLRLGLTTIGDKGKVKLYVPPSLAYGSKGADPAIGPNEYLIIDVELTSATKRMTYY